jgi:hypothetical protein
VRGETEELVGLGVAAWRRYVDRSISVTGAGSLWPMIVAL